MGSAPEIDCIQTESLCPYPCTCPCTCRCVGIGRSYRLRMTTRQIVPWIVNYRCLGHGLVVEWAWRL